MPKEPWPNGGFPATGIVDWKFIDPPKWSADLADFIVADRILPDGTEQLMIRGTVGGSKFVKGAQLVGLDDYIATVAAPVVEMRR